MHQSLSWNLNISLRIPKSHQRRHFLCRRRVFVVSQAGIINFYRATMERVLTCSILVWCGSATSQDQQQLESVVRRASKVIGCSLPTIASHYHVLWTTPMHKLFATSIHTKNFIVYFIVHLFPDLPLFAPFSPSSTEPESCTPL